MASLSRVMMFSTEVAPPEYVSLKRLRAAKTLATINEEERDVITNDNVSLSSKPFVTAAAISKQNFAVPRSVLVFK